MQQRSIDQPRGSVASLRIREEAEDRPATRRKIVAACLLGAVAIHGALAVVPVNFGGAAVQYGIQRGDHIEVTIMFDDDSAPAPDAIAMVESTPPPIEAAADMQLPAVEQAVAAASEIASALPAIEQRRTSAALAPDAARRTAPSRGAGRRTVAKPNYLRNPRPKYPAESRKQREEGVVLLKVSVTAEGRAADVQLQRSSGYARLDDAALRAVRKWEFNPARVGVTAVACAVEVPVRFGLN